MNVYIKPVEYCNMKCLHCYNQPKSDSINYDNLNLFLKNLNNLTHDNYFILHGGEPLLAHPCKILNLLESFPNNRWRITTNLSIYIDNERLEILKKMNEVRTSFDIGIRFMNIKNLIMWYKNTKKLIHNSIPVYLNVCLSTIMLKKNPAKLLKMLDDLGIKILSFEMITDVGMAHENNYLIPSYKDVDNWLCELHKASKEYPNIRIRTFEDVMFGINKDLKNFRTHECCKSTLTINSNGTIGGCPNDASINTIGDLNTPIEEILQSKCSIRCNTRKECLSCDIYDQCFGGCAQLEWQGDTCPYPRNLGNIIREEMDKSCK